MANGYPYSRLHRQLAMGIIDHNEGVKRDIARQRRLTYRRQRPRKYLVEELRWHTPQRRENGSILRAIFQQRGTFFHQPLQPIIMKPRLGYFLAETRQIRGSSRYHSANKAVVTDRSNSAAAEVAKSPHAEERVIIWASRKFQMPSSRCFQCGAVAAGPAEEPLDLDVAPGTLHHALLTTNEPPITLRNVFVDTAVCKTESPFRRGGQPMVLTQISSHWRAIALSTSSLWSLICISYPDEYPLAMVKTQVERAPELKIHFYVSQESESRPQIEMFEFLSEHFQRWKELGLQLTSDLFPLLDTLQDNVPLLRRLSIQWDGPESQTEVESINYFQTAVSLVDMDIYSETPALEGIALLCLRGIPDSHLTADILHKHPSITEFAIIVASRAGEMDLADSLHDHLALLLFDQRTAVSPHLSKIYFGCENIHRIDLYLSMLQSRWKSNGCALKAAAFASDLTGPDPPTCRALDALRDDGLDLRVVMAEKASDLTNPWIYDSDLRETLAMFGYFLEISARRA
ncbi:hypothetical protein DFH07DRAFT_936058 [Mycena maculata]|uniref:Uncharacterized protein n=1 Tax=Mycena maculata TaxID=230809 RepID=A0AAD7NYD4_9AGAR|nr:hypothetical protein DFH07DRAFT_936058 [Mycena maculata]